MDVATTLGITPEPVLYRRLCRTQMGVAIALGIPPEPVLYRRLCRT